MTALLDAALAYARRGWYVLPCRYKYKDGAYQKVPRIQGGHHSATIDEVIIRAWWERWPNALIGISLQVSGLVVIDVDPRNGGDETIATLEAKLGPLPRDCSVLTPRGGEHIYLQRPDGAARGTLGPGVDVKCDGYVIAPPSPGPDDHTPSYRWCDDA